MAQPGMTDGQAGHPRASFRIRDIGDQALVVDLLNENGTVTIRPSNSGTATWGHIQRRQTLVVIRPLRA